MINDTVTQLNRLTLVSISTQSFIVVTPAVNVLRGPGHVNTHLARRQFAMKLSHGGFEQFCVGSSFSTIGFQIILEVEIDSIYV